MLNNIYILRKVVEEMQQFVGCKIVDCYSDNQGILHFDIYDGDCLFNITISLITNFEAIFVTKSGNKSKRNMFKQFNSILGEVIQKIEIVPQNRILKFELINKNLYIQIFGKSQNNAILTNKSESIIDCLRNRKELINSKYAVLSQSLKEISDFPENFKLLKAISGSKFLFGKDLSNELLFRLSIDTATTLSELSSQDLENIENGAELLSREIEQSQIYYYSHNEDNSRILSPVKLNKYPFTIEESSSLFLLIRKVFSDRISQFRFDRLLKTLKNIDEKIIKKYEAKVKRFHEIPKLLKIIEQYQHFTDLLYTIQNLKQKGLEKIQITDFEGNNIDIPLDAKMTIIQNIEKYYLKIKKIKRDISIIEKNHNAIKDEYNIHNQRFQKLITIDKYIDLKKFYKQNLIFYKKSMQNIPKEISEKFRKFEISANATLYVGKDSKNNDELTFGLGKPNDYWFHLRGGSGSHCILKYSGKGKPPKEVLEKSASIAAYYSSQRNGGFVPVIYTQKKYVRKPKGANPGSVVVAKEEVIMVEPKSYDDVK